MLLPPGSPRSVLWPGEEPRRGDSSRVCATDWDGDGKVDLLVGDCQYIRRIREGLTAEQQAAARVLVDEHLKLQKREAELLERREAEMWRLGYRAPDSFTKDMAALDEIWGAMERTASALGPYAPSAEPHGYVWFYKRK